MLLMALLSMCIGVQAEMVTLSDTPVTLGGNGYLLSDAGLELKNALAQVGDVVIFKVDIEHDGDFWLQIREGHWGQDDDDIYLSINQDDVSDGYIYLTLTQNILDKAYQQQWWGGTFIINGGSQDPEDNFSLTVESIYLNTQIDRLNYYDEVEFNEWGFIPASAFNGYDDNAKVEFVYEVTGDLQTESSSVVNWGIGSVTSSDADQSQTLATLPASATGILSNSFFLSDVKELLEVSPDGIMFNVWSTSNGDANAVATRNAVRIYDVASDRKDLDLTNLDMAWGETTYDASTKTITIGDDWSGTGWWYGDRNFSHYNYLVVNFAEMTPATLNVEMKTTDNEDAGYASLAPRCLQVVIPLDGDLTSNIAQIYFKGPEGMVYQINEVYLCTEAYKTENNITDIYINITDHIDLPFDDFVGVGIALSDTEMVHTEPSGSYWENPGSHEFSTGWFVFNADSELLDAFNQFDYAVVEFSQPTSSRIGLLPCQYDADRQMVGYTLDNPIVIDPFCTTYFIPLPELEGDMNGFGFSMAFEPFSITHISRVYLAKKSYLTDTMYYSEDDLANGIFGEGETVTIGSTGYATISFAGTVWDYYFPGGLKGYDYKYVWEINSGVPPVLQVAHTYEPDAKISGNHSAVLKTDAEVELPFTFYFPKADTEQQGEYNMLETENACLFGTETAQETENYLPTSFPYFYKLSTKNGKNVGFYWGAPDGGPFINGAKKAYLILPNYNEYEAANGYVFDADMNLVPDGSTTGITDIATDVEADAPAYNLNGQRVGSSYRGIVIQNGKKTTRK